MMGRCNCVHCRVIRRAMLINIGILLGGLAVILAIVWGPS